MMKTMALSMACLTMWGYCHTVHAQTRAGYQHKLLATNKTSTMEKEMNEAAEAGYQFDAVMGGDTAVGGSEVVVVVSRMAGSRPRYAYKLLATSRTSTWPRCWSSPAIRSRPSSR